MNRQPLDVSTPRVPGRPPAGPKARASRPSMPRWKRALRIAALVIVGVYAFYLVAINVALRTRLVQDALNAEERSLLVGWDSAWSIAPGRIEVRGFFLRLQDANVQTYLELPRASVDVDPLALTRKTFHARHVRAEGTRYFFRHKLSAAEGNEGRLAAYPPIPGFSEPPVRVKPPPTEIPDALYNLWTVDVDDVVAHADEVWIMEYHYRGEALAKGSFMLVPARRFELSPASLETFGGVLSIGDEDLVRGATGRVDATVDAFDVREDAGLGMTRHIDAAIHLDGAMNLAALGTVYVAPPKKLAGVAEMRMNVRVSRGVFTPESAFAMRSDRITFETGEASLQGDLAVDAWIKDGEPQITARSVRGSVMAGRRSATAPVLVEGLDVEAVIDGADVATARSLSSLHVKVPSVDAHDLRAVGRLVPEDVALEGKARAAVTLDVRGERVDARLDATLERAMVASGDLQLTASGKAFTQLSGTRTALTGTQTRAELPVVDLRVGKARVQNVRFDVNADGARVTAAGSLDAAVNLTAGPGDRTLRFFADVAGLPEPIRAVAGETTNVPLRAGLRVHVGETDEVRLIHGVNGPLEAKGTFRSAKARSAGAFLVTIGFVNVGLSLDQGKVGVTPLAGEGWLSERTQKLP